MAVDDFSRPLTCLADMGATDMGFTRPLYGYIPVAPKVRNGDWIPLS